MAHDELTIERIKTFHPQFRQQLKTDYLTCNNTILGKGVRLRFSHVFRSVQEQDKLYAKGITTDGRIVTNAKGGQSIHNYGLAFDIVLLVDKDGNGSLESASWDIKKDFDGDKQSDWLEVANFFTHKQRFTPYEWGGDWKNFKDYPHFQIKGYDWRKLQKLVEQGYTIEDNGIIYPDLDHYGCV